jgi:hypothetical protein
MKFGNIIRYDGLYPVKFEGLTGGGSVKTAIDLLKKVPGVAIYGFLLTSNPENSLSQLIRKRWYELHNLSGLEGQNLFLLVVFEPPVEFFDSFKTYWTQQLGESFEKIWKEYSTYTRKSEPGRAFNYCDHFGVDPTKVPCLVLFTDLNNQNEQKIVLRTIPEWDSDSLFEFLSGSITLIKECCKRPINERMNCLESSLTSPSANVKFYSKHMKRQVMDYMKEHPAMIVTMTVSIAAALANASLLPFGLPAVTILNKLKDELKNK